MPDSLEVPEWLAAKAADDDPRTLIDDDLLAPFKKMGVTKFRPLVGQEVVGDEEGDRATGIGAPVPGLPLGDSFEDEPAPVLGSLKRLLTYLERFDDLRRLKLAAKDMREVERAARAILAGGGPSPVFERVVETGLVVTYARPYIRGRGGTGGLPGRWQPPHGPGLDFHRRLIKQLRNKDYAHSDRTWRRTIVDTATLLGDDAIPTFVESATPLSRVELETLADLAHSQAERLEEGAKEAERKLREGLTIPVSSRPA